METVMSSDHAPMVSVVMPLYQSRDYVAAALDSALAQTFADLEVIVVDDGSTDGGGEIARGYAERDLRVRYIRQENAGPAAARNGGISTARGQVVAFLDSDDLWLPDKLACQVPLLAERTVVHSDAYVLRDGGTVGEERIGARVTGLDGADPLGALLRGNCVAALTTVVPRKLLVEHGCFDSSLRSIEDYDLWLRLAADGVRFAYVPRPLAVYRSRMGSLSADRVCAAETTIRVYEKLVLTHPESPRRMRASLRRQRRVLATELWRRGRRTIAVGDVAAGRPDLVRAVRTAPLWWKSWVLTVMLGVPPLLRLTAANAERQAAEASIGFRTPNRDALKEDGVRSR